MSHGFTCIAQHQAFLLWVTEVISFLGTIAGFQKSLELVRKNENIRQRKSSVWRMGKEEFKQFCATLDYNYCFTPLRQFMRHLFSKYQTAYFSALSHKNYSTRNNNIYKIKEINVVCAHEIFLLTKKVLCTT